MAMRPNIPTSLLNSITGPAGVMPCGIEWSWYGHVPTDEGSAVHR